MEIKKSANLECYYGNHFPNNSIQTFGFDFIALRNVTFSWESAVKSKFSIKFLIQYVSNEDLIEKDNSSIDCNF